MLSERQQEMKAVNEQKGFTYIVSIKKVTNNHLLQPIASALEPMVGD